MLRSLVDSSRTDKDTVHSYLDVYENLFAPIKDNALNVLEVGICHGGSIKLWHDYFTNATVYGLDIIPLDQVWSEIRNKQRIKLLTSTDAYRPEVVQTLGVKFDMVLDDGPHSLESMLAFVKHYTPLLSEKGILVIEDIQHYEWTKKIIDSFPLEYQKAVQVVDLRGVKGRYDDLIIILDKSKL
jgi:cephalosporin hydroxylase